MSLLSLDIGDKRVGVAYTIEGIAYPYKVVPRVEIIRELKQLILEKKITDIIIGIPYTNLGLSKQAIKIQHFSKKIRDIFPDIQLHFVDERFTTLIPKQEFGSREPVDLISALMILETYISRTKKNPFT